MVRLNKIGAVMVPVNTGFLQNETRFILNDAGCRGVICDEKFLENVVMPSVRRVRRLNGSPCARVPPVPG